MAKLNLKSLGRFIAAPLGDLRKHFDFKAASGLVQSLAALATVGGAVVATSQYLRSEELLRERQSALAEAAALTCMSAADVMVFSGVSKDSESMVATFADSQAAAVRGLEDFSLGDMPTAQAVLALQACRDHLRRFAAGGDKRRDPIALCVNGISMKEAGRDLLAEARIRRSSRASEFDVNEVKARITECHRLRDQDRGTRLESRESNGDAEDSRRGR